MAHGKKEMKDGPIFLFGNADGDYYATKIGKHVVYSYAFNPDPDKDDYEYEDVSKEDVMYNLSKKAPSVQKKVRDIIKRMEK